jgi:amino acid adenylation domain-containing protein
MSRLELGESLVGAFAAHAARTPHRAALCQDGGRVWSYQELAEQSWAVAAALRRLGVQRESRVAILGGRAAGTVVVILGILAAGAAYAPIDPQWPAVRRRRVLEELAPTAMVRVDDDTPAAYAACPVLDLDAIAPQGHACRPDWFASGPELAYVLFTSGSTGQPRGVMVENGSVCNMLRSYEQLAPGQKVGAGTLIAPTAFDVSVWEIFSVLGFGRTLHVPLQERLAGGDELCDYLARTGVESAYVPPGLLAPLEAAAQRGPRLSLRRVLVGVEPIAQGLLQRLSDACPGLIAVNGYGPTETTITATLHRFAGVVDPHRRVPIGRPVLGSTVEIVDDRLKPVPAGAVGELVVFGACVARGYLNSASGGFLTIAGRRAYRTGDFGRLLPCGEIEFTGRGDGQLKINGFRVETGEVEAAVSSAAGVRRCVVLPVGDAGARRLVAAVEVAENVVAADVLTHAREVLPEHAIPSRVMVLRRLPLTPNGKVDGDALTSLLHSRPRELPHYVEPGTAWQRLLADAWREVLGIGTIGIDDDFHALGGSSLDGVRVSTWLRGRGHHLLAGAVLAGRTIRRLEEPSAAPKPVEPARPGSAAATRSQQGIWAWRELNPLSPNITVVHVIKLQGPVDPRRLSEAFDALVRRHEALRTTMDVGADHWPVQHVAAQAACGLETVTVDAVEDVARDIEQWLAHRFDVRRRAWAARLLLGSSFGALVFAADHAVFDGESADILQRDLAQLYDGTLDKAAPAVAGPAALGSSLTPPAEVAQGLRRWWRDALSGSDVAPVLPEPLYVGARDLQLQRTRTPLTGWVCEGMASLARSVGTTTFVVVLTALQSFLRVRGDSPDCTVSIAMTRRHAVGATEAIGNFVNLVPVRTPRENWHSLPFVDCVARTAALHGEATAHGELPFEDIIAFADVRPSGTGVAALARVVLVQEPPVRTHATGAGVTFSAWPEIPRNAIYDLCLFFSEGAGGAQAGLEWVWPRGAMPEECPGWIAQAFAGFLAAAVASPASPIDAFPRHAAQEAALIAATLMPSRRTGDDAGAELVSLFEAQVQERPHAPAVEHTAGCVSYLQLSRRAWSIALAIGTHHDRAPVVVVLDKGPDLLAAMLAVLRTGSPYVPLAPEHARTRLPDLALDSNAVVCVTDARSATMFRLPDRCRLVLVDDLAADVAALAGMSHHPDDLAYLMPTSGSTGRPKLVGITHRAVVRLVHRSGSLPLDENDKTMLVSNTSFDAATFEIWGALLNGGCVVVPTPEQLREPELLAAAVERHRVTAAFFTTTLFDRLLPDVHRFRHMRHIIVGGEAVPPRLLSAAAQVIPARLMINGYGPTENTTFSCCYRLEADPASLRSVPIGPPITGSGAVVVDEQLRPVAPGMPGEILVTGDGLASGYLNDPALTDARFVELTAPVALRAYRTGDRGRLLPDGSLEYLGRLDRQLKVRGFRIEPREVEVVLAGHPAVRRCVAYADKLDATRVLLAAVEATGTKETELRNWLWERLPDFMVPTRIYIVGQLPMTDNGKLNHAALRETVTPSTAATVSKPPSSPLERVVCVAVAQLLDRQGVERDDNFFDLGANSMTVLALTARLRQELGQPVPNHWVYSAPTARLLARRLEGPGPGPVNSTQRALARAARIRRSGG